MHNLAIASFFLGGLVTTTVGFGYDVEQLPETYCITYLSTFLVPISGIESSTTLNGALTSSLSPALEQTSASLSTVASSTTSATTEAELLVFLVVPDTSDSDRSLGKRNLGGFIGSPSEICAGADIFRLVDGQLLEGNSRVFYNGEDFKPFGGQSEDLPSSAITRTFSRDGGNLRFLNSELPNGEAGFCQDPEDNQVYITFSSQPAGCVPVRLSAIAAQDCQDGDISTSTAGVTSAQQFTSAKSQQPDVSSVLSSDRSLPVITTGQATEPGLTTSPASPVSTTSAIPQPILSSTFRWSNISSSPPNTLTFHSFSTVLLTSQSSTPAEVKASTSTESAVEFSSALATSELPLSLSATESSTVIDFTSTSAAETTSELTSKTTSYKATTSTAGQTSTETTTADTNTTTATETSTETTADSTTEESQDTSTTTSVETSTETTTDSTSGESEDTTTTTAGETPTETTSAASTTETTTDLTTTTFTSALDSTTETTTEPATTTTAQAQIIICPSNPNQCFNTMEIYCDTVIGGISLTPGTFTAQQCFEKCRDDPNCVIFTHNGDQCFLTSDPNDNQGSFTINGWISGIKGSC